MPETMIELLNVDCLEYKFDLTACELDKDYYEAALKRFNNHKAQQVLF